MCASNAHWSVSGSKYSQVVFILNVPLKTSFPCGSLWTVRTLELGLHAALMTQV